eukprot:5935710-Amphidinium_carterae.1
MGYTLSGLMGLEDTVAIPTFIGAGSATLLTLVNVSGCLLAVVRALEECSPTAKGLLKPLRIQAIQSGQRQPIARHGDLEDSKCELGMPLLRLGSKLTRLGGRITIEDFQGSQEADVVLRDRPEAWPRARLPAAVEEEAAPQVLPADPLPQTPRE